MALRERKDCTEEGLVPRADAIQSSLLPSSTHRRMSSMNFLSEILWFIPTCASYFGSGPRRIRPTLDARQGRAHPPDDPSSENFAQTAYYEVRLAQPKRSCSTR